MTCAERTRVDYRWCEPGRNRFKSPHGIIVAQTSSALHTENVTLQIVNYGPKILYINVRSLKHEPENTQHMVGDSGGEDASGIIHFRQLQLRTNPLPVEWSEELISVRGQCDKGIYYRLRPWREACGRNSCNDSEGVGGGIQQFSVRCRDKTNS